MICFNNKCLKKYNYTVINNIKMFCHLKSVVNIAVNSEFGHHYKMV